MKFALILGLLGAALLPAQPTLTLTGNAFPAKPGALVTMTLSLSNTGLGNVAGLQVTVGIPVGFNVTDASVIQGPAVVAASKILFASPNAWTNQNPGRVAIAGMNRNTIGDGVLLTFTGTVGAAGQLPFILSNNWMASPEGNSVASSLGPQFTLQSASPCDINSDGTVDLADVQAYITSFIYAANSNPAACDLTGDGFCRIEDVQRIANAGVPGGACVIGPQ